MKVKVLNTQTQVEIREMNLTDSIDRSGECLLGRSPHSGLVLDSPDVSRLHAKFSVEDGQYYFYDLGSANGSLVNGKIVQPNQGHLLKPGDIIRLGEFVLILQTVSEQSEDLAATVVGDPNATVLGLPPKQDWVSNKELDSVLKITDEQLDQPFEVEQAIETENIAEQDDEQSKESENDAGLLVETDLSNSSIVPEIDESIAGELIAGESIAVELTTNEQSLQPESIEALELSELETFEESELTESTQSAEQEELEPVEALESSWAGGSAETIDEPSSSEPVKILSSELITVEPDAEIDEIQSVEQTQESDLAEPIGQILDQQVPDAKGFNPDSFSEPTLIQPDESENLPLLLQPDESIEPEFSSVEAPDSSISELDNLVESEAVDNLTEFVAVSESTVIQPADLAETEEFSSLDSEPEFSSEPTFIQTDIQLDEQSNEPFDQFDESIETTEPIFEPSSESLLTENDALSDEEIIDDSSDYWADGTVVQLSEPIETEELFASIPEPAEFSEPTVIQLDELDQLTEASIPVAEPEPSQLEESSHIESEIASGPTQLQLDPLDQMEEVAEEIVFIASQPVLDDEPVLDSAEEITETDDQFDAAQTEMMPELTDAIESSETFEMKELEDPEETEDTISEPAFAATIVEEIIAEETTSEDTPDPIVSLSETNQISADNQIAAPLEPSIEPIAIEEFVAVDEIRSIDETEKLDEVTGLSNEDEVTGLSAEEIQELDPIAAALDQIASEAVEAALLETVESINPVTSEVDQTEAEATEATEATIIPDLGSQAPDLTETPTTYPDKYIALLAHDNQKSELIDFVARHKDLLSHCLTVAIPSISDLLKQDLNFEVSQQTPAIPPGGYQTINSLITSDKILAVIFLRDFFTPQTTQANDEAFSRSCNIHQVMFASNLPTAEAIVRAIRTTVATPQL